MLTRLWLYLYRVSRAKLGIRAGQHVMCCECGARMRKGDRFKILEVIHLDCRDRKKTGQMSLEGLCTSSLLAFTMRPMQRM